LKVCLRNGIPALYHDVSSLIRVNDETNPSKFVYTKDPLEFRQHPITTMCLDLVNEYIPNLRLYSTFDHPSITTNTSLDNENFTQSDNNNILKKKNFEPPIALLWALYLKSHLLEMSGNLQEAMNCIDECIEHTPTAIDMYTKKARLFKKMGDYEQAKATMDEARELDLQDRYLNNKATKYLLRSNHVTTAMSTIAMFTKHDGDPQKILHDLQCNWYEIELAEAYSRIKIWGLALKNFSAIKKHFNDYFDDLFDFHGYCIRKVFFFFLFLYIL
jgi:peptide alpha-N-acetyltransferase